MTSAFTLSGHNSLKASLESPHASLIKREGEGEKWLSNHLRCNLRVN